LFSFLVGLFEERYNNLYSLLVHATGCINESEKLNFKGDITVLLILTTLSFPGLIQITERSSTDAISYQISFSGGSGTSSDPFLISTIRDLQDVGTELDSDFLLINNIDCTPTSLWNNGDGFLPIGNSSNPFNGSINGNGYSIRNLHINSLNNSVGLFSVISSNVHLMNLNIINANINGKQNVGGISGICYGNISNCFVNGTINGQSNVGGIVGYLDSTKGLSSGTVSHCKSNVDVSGSDYVGGLIGNSFGGNIRNCTTVGIATGYAKYYGGVGGILGGGSAYLEFSNSSMIVKGSDSVGGLVGTFNNLDITNCLATGAVISNGSNCGGLVGYISIGLIKNSYSICSVNGITNVGGLVGGQYISESTYSFWNTETSGISTSPMGSGKTSTQMRLKASFYFWNFNSIWNIVEGESYPFLRSFNHSYVDIIEISKPIILEDSYFSIDINASSDLPGGFGAYYSITTNAGNWLTFSGKGEINGIPENNDVGEYWINISATINYHSYDYLNFTLEVQNTNDPPTINDIEIGNILEDTQFIKQFSAIDIDPDQDQLLWSMVSNSNFLKMDQNSGVLSGIPNNDDVGEWWIMIGVDDGNGGQDEINLSFNVENVNDAPTIIPIEDMKYFQDEVITIKLEGVDIDPTKDNFLWSMDTDAGFLEIGRRSGIIEGMAGNEDVGSWEIEINLSDEKGGFDNQIFNIEIVNTNDDPLITDFSIPDLLEDIPFTLDIDAIDVDIDDKVFTWYLDSNASFITFDEVDGIISGTPENGDVGEWWINVSVFDEHGGFDYQNFTVIVIGTNDQPEAYSDHVKEVSIDEDSEGYSIDLNSIFYDIDNEILSYEVYGSSKIKVSINKNIALLIPVENWNGEEKLIFTASDGYLSKSVSINVIINPINDAPTDVSIIANDYYFEGEDQVVNSSANDPDIPYGDELIFTWFSNITGEIGTGQSINLSLPSGHHQITIIVKDKNGLTNSSSKNIVIHSIVQPGDNTTVNSNGNNNTVLIIISILIALILVVSIIVVIIFFKQKKVKDISQPRQDGSDEGDIDGISTSSERVIEG